MFKSDVKLTWYHALLYKISCNAKLTYMTTSNKCLILPSAPSVLFILEPRATWCNSFSQECQGLIKTSIVGTWMHVSSTLKSCTPPTHRRAEIRHLERQAAVTLCFWNHGLLRIVIHHVTIFEYLTNGSDFATSQPKSLELWAHCERKLICCKKIPSCPLFTSPNFLKLLVLAILSISAISAAEPSWYFPWQFCEAWVWWSIYIKRGMSQSFDRIR